MDRRRWFVAGITIAGTVVLAVVLPPARQIAVASLLLLLPGYALSLALLATHELRISESVTVILAIGAASLAIGGLIVTGLPYGVSAEAWVGFVTVLASFGVVVAAFRGRPPVPSHFSTAWIGAPVLATLIALAAAGGALFLARAGAEEQDRMQTFSELWAVPTEGQMLNVGLTSHENDTRTYRIDVELDDKLIARWSDISLPPGGTWEKAVAAPMVPEGADLQILAFMNGDETPYRSVVLHGSTP